MTNSQKILYLDCSSGISGDMFLGSLIDCGLGLERLSSQLRKMKIGGYRLKSHKVKRAGLTGTKFDVIYNRRHTRGHSDGKTFKSIVNSIRSSALSGRIKERAIAVLTNLAEAEGRAHGLPLEKVHFHEAGDIDSVVDIVGACIALEELGIDKIYSSRVVSGTGTVSVHGSEFPNPAPATAYLLRGLEVAIADVPFELVTPTGAALLKTFSKPVAAMPPLKILKIGYGAGTRQVPGRPNLLRAVIGEPQTGGDTDSVTVIETNIDEMNPQIYEHLVDRLFEAGALDVYVTPVIMKKSRPACVLTVLAEPAAADTLSAVIFEETPTFGIRRYPAERLKLERKIVEVKTKYGKIKVKLGFFKGALKTYSPEYEDCRKAARAKRVPFDSVRREAEAAFRPIKGERRGFAK